VIPRVNSPGGTNTISAPSTGETRVSGKGPGPSIWVMFHGGFILKLGIG
jgi:hypothetical protein